MAAPELAPETEVPCTVCGGWDAEVLRTASDLEVELEALKEFHRRRLRRCTEEALQERATFTHDYATAIRVCKECGLLYRSPRPSSEDVRRAYEQERYDGQRLDLLHEAQFQSFQDCARALVSVLGRGARVLEVGSFVGGFLRAAAEAGLRATGLDPGEQTSAYATRRGLPVERTRLEDFARGEATGHWDAICIWNTFDQLPRPGPVLAAADRLLADSGSLWLRVPNGDRYRKWASRSHPAVVDPAFAALAWNNLIGFPYLHGYSTASLGRLTEQHGFRRVGVRGRTLCPLAGSDHAAWARVEEAVYKAAQGVRARVRPRAAPWLELQYRPAG